MVVRYKRPWLYKEQADALFCSERYSFIEASTKSGKTVGALAWLAEQAMMRGKRGRQFWWIAPVYRQARIAFRRLSVALPEGLRRVSEGGLSITLANGAQIVFLSGVDANSLYGDDVWAAVIDEASRTKEAVWHAIRTTLTATRGSLRAIGNVVDRRNWFYRKCREAENGGIPNYHYARITWKDAVRAGVLVAEEIEDARRSLPSRQFFMLYEAIAPDNVEGALWNYEILDRCRVDRVPEMKRIVIAIDPALSANEDSNETGIVVVGLGSDSHGYLLEDASGVYTPDAWGRRAVDLYYRWNADRIIAEVNAGGDLVESNLRLIDRAIAIRKVHAARGKWARAEPVAALYEREQCHHVGIFTLLEDQLCTYVPGVERSPDRLDALVWGFTELLVSSSPDLKAW